MTQWDALTLGAWFFSFSSSLLSSPTSYHTSFLFLGSFLIKIISIHTYNGSSPPHTTFPIQSLLPRGNHFQSFLLFLLAVTSLVLNKVFILLFLDLAVLEHIFPPMIVEDRTFLYHHSHLFSPILLIHFSCYFSVSTDCLYNVTCLCFSLLSLQLQAVSPTFLSRTKRSRIPSLRIPSTDFPPASHTMSLQLCLCAKPDFIAQCPDAWAPKACLSSSLLPCQRGPTVCQAMSLVPGPPCLEIASSNNSDEEK